MDAGSVSTPPALAPDLNREANVDTGDEAQPPQDRSKLKQTLDSLRAGLSGSPFHLGSIKRSNSTKGSDREENPREKVKARKKSKKSKSSEPAGAWTASDRDEGEGRAPSKSKRRRNQAGALVRKLGELAGRRGTRGAPPAADNDEDGSQSGSARDMDERSSTASTASQVEGDAPAAADAPTDGDTASEDIAAEQAVSILPFAKSSWTRRRSQEMERPVEAASAESTLRRRIAFVSQASAQLSEEGADAAAKWGAVARALRSASRTPPDEAEHTESYDELEEPAPAPASMPAFGDLIADEPPAQTDMGVTLSSSHATAPGGERREHLYKILVIGELGTGKTSIIKRYVHQFFSQHYRATIGVDFALKVLNWDANTIIRLQLWDIAGQERFGNMTRVYYKEAVGAFIVFDVTRVATFDAVVKWKMDLDSKVQLPDGSPIPCVLLANKCDQQKEGIVNSTSKMEEYCREKGFAGWFETSAKENVNIEEAARSLVNKILLNDKLLQSNDGRDNDKFSLEHKIANGQDLAGTSSKNCSC